MPMSCARTCKQQFPIPIPQEFHQPKAFIEYLHACCLFSQKNIQVSLLSMLENKHRVSFTSKKKNSLPVSFHQRWVELLPMKAKRNQVHRFNDALILFFLLLMIFKRNYPLYLFLYQRIPSTQTTLQKKPPSTARGHTKYKKKRSCISDPFLRPLPYGEMNTT